jgi:pyruvate dehydrogenase (quinone)
MASMAKKTVGEILVDRLIDWGVDTIFGLPGDGINGIFEGLRTRQDKIGFIQVRHEEAAAFAACGYAKYTGAMGTCLATSGPGGVHLLNGLYDAKFDGQPVLAITGHTLHDLIGTHFQQDVDLDKLFCDVAAYNERIMGPHHVDNVVDEAIRTALTRRTVAHVTIPKDIQDWDASDTQRSEMNVARHRSDLFAPSWPVPPQTNIQRAADVINLGKKVAILVGRGCLNARQPVIDLAEKAAAPISWALLGKTVVPDENPLNVGRSPCSVPPLLGRNEELRHAYSGGYQFPLSRVPTQAGPGQVRADRYRPNSHRAALSGRGGAGRRLSPRARSAGPSRAAQERAQFPRYGAKVAGEWIKLMEERANRTDKPLKPQMITHHINRFLRDDAIIACDCGTVTTWAARYLRIRDQMKFTCTGMLATMANGLPYAIGAAVAFPGRQVLAFVGDGGFTMLMGEMATLVKYQLPVKVVVIKNNSLGQIKWEQMVFEGNPEYGVDLQPIDFAAYARACGAGGYTVDDPRQVDDVLHEAFKHPGPALIEAVVDPNEPPLPGNITTEQAFNFARSLVRGERDRWAIIKTVLEDRREVV